MKPLLLLALTASLATAQSTISPANKYAYAANAGWIDFRGNAPDGVRVSDTFLAGYAYAANFGWIHLGSGTPTNGHTYSNTSATNYGVNMAPDGKLTGYAYAANIGWINFEQAQGLPKIDLTTGTFSGYAHAANIGWIALNTPSSTLATATISRPDTDGDGLPDAWEQLYYGNLTTANATSNSDGDGANDLAEYNAGTIPTDATSSFRITGQTFSAGFANATLTYTAVDTRRYRIEYNSDLGATWTDSGLGTFAPSITPIATANVTGLPLPATKRFFRATAIALP